VLGDVEENVEKVLLVDVYEVVLSSVDELVSLEVLVVGVGVVVLDGGVVVQVTGDVVPGVVLLGIDV
jgi:hypothetical protein